MERLVACLEGGLSGTSDTVAAYEAELAAWFDARHALAVSSGAAAVTVALAALGLKRGDEVLLTPTCPLCTVYPILNLGLVPKFCDIQPDCFSFHLEDLARSIGPRTRALIDIPMWGYPVPIIALRQFADYHELPLLLDLALCSGTEFSGRPIWSYADIATFSTHESKILSTGEGGGVLTNNALYAERGRLYSRFGGLDGVNFGLNYKMSAPQAAIGVGRLRQLAYHIKRRRENARKILDGLDNPWLEELPVVPNGRPNYLTILLRTTYADNRELIAHLATYGIPSDITTYDCKPLYLFPILASYARTCTNAERMLASITTVPCHPALGEAELAYILSALNTFRPSFENHPGMRQALNAC
ncbi:MAG TPA: DegT/DnrJ/EryC1/StrS family aminotransferase [Dongiaceae bacterium]|jgi:dTDP-4-amino-4,6-dideoxygalactose transaminase|nr:DegT/DnrJ/EryC1/StrS family aminotransferase [Dongiaceae bacterium]